MQDKNFGSSTMVDTGTSLRIYINQSDVSAFRELIQRGANLWPDAPPAMKQFADLVTTGHILQDYSTEVASTKK